MGRTDAGRAEAERPRVGAPAGLAERPSCARRARNSCCSGLSPAAGAAAGAECPLAAGRTGEGVRELGRTEPERPRVGTGAGLAERPSCARRARNSCCSGLKLPAGAAADELYLGAGAAAGAGREVGRTDAGREEAERPRVGAGTGELERAWAEQGEPGQARCQLGAAEVEGETYQQAYSDTVRRRGEQQRGHGRVVRHRLCASLARKEIALQGRALQR